MELLYNRSKSNGGEIELDDKAANQMLDNIFRACDKTSGTMSIEYLRLREKSRGMDFAFYRTLSLALLIALLLTPFLFIPSSLKMSYVQQGMDKATLEFTVNSLLPVMDIKAQFDGNSLEVTPVKYNGYTALIELNGSLNVDVTLINGRSSSFNLIISSLKIDKAAPVITGSSLDGNELTVFVSDNDAGVDFYRAYAVDGEGRKTLPLDIDKKTDT